MPTHRLSSASSATGSSYLTRKLSLIMLLVLGLSSTAFLGIVFSAYSLQLRQEREEASYEINEVLRSALENAMLKRDLTGLQHIVDNMAEQSAIDRVTIINTQGQIRFSSQHNLLNTDYPTPLNELCFGCEGGLDGANNTSSLITLPDGKEVIRSVNPVANRAECVVCHGASKINPINGILIVDYEASSIKTKAMTGIAGLLAAGLVVIMLTLATIWFYMNKYVLNPIAKLSSLSVHLANGNLEARAPQDGMDEISSLGRSINRMARSLQSSIQTIQDNEQYLQTLIDTNPDGIRVIDSEFRIRKYNNGYRQMLGKEKSAMTYCFQSSHNRDKPCIPTLVTCPVHELRAGSGTLKTMQQFINKDGEKIETQVYAAPLMLGPDKELMVVESVRDLSHDIKYSQEHRLSSLGQLAAGVGHEIMNPLTSIRFALQSTLETLKDSPSSIEEATEYLELVDGQIDRCIDVTNRLRKLSVLSDEHLQLVSVNSAISETVSLLRYEGEQINVHIDLHLDATEPRLLASESDVRTVILNLVQNAYHAMPEGGTLTITSYSDEEYVYIDYHDTGTGINEEDLPRIFDPFFSRRADGKHGMGLGLSISLSLAEHHQGQINVKVLRDGDTALGSIFTVVYPKAN